MAAPPPCRGSYNTTTNILCKSSSISTVGLYIPLKEPRARPAQCFSKEIISSHKFMTRRASPFLIRTPFSSISKKLLSTIPRCSGGGGNEESSNPVKYIGMDPLQAGNVVQLVLVLGLTVGWISTYIFRVSNKEMTYAQQLRDYEVKVMEKRLESLTEAEIQALLEQVEEEKTRLASGEQAK